MRFFVDFDQLTVDSTSYDGEIGLAFTGTVGNRSVVLDADFTFSDGGMTEIDLSNVSISVGEAGVVIDGSGSLVTPSVAATFATSAVTWAGECLPTSGSLDYTSGSTSATITFLNSTPIDGVVTVQVGSFVTNVALLPPCI